MLKELGIIRRSARIAACAACTAVDAYAKDRIEHEPHITDRMLGGIERELDGKKIKGLVWEAKTLTSSGDGSQESKYGADFMGVLNINLNQYKISKGFLAQAKRMEARIDRGELVKQCERMLSYTPASFVFLYSKKDIRVIPASAVIASGGTNLLKDEVYSRSIFSFFEIHFVSFLGDTKIKAASRKQLCVLSKDFGVSRGILLSLTSEAYDGSL